MKRIFPNYVYGDAPRAGCWWDETCDMPATRRLDAGITCDVAVVGAGITGLNAAITLAEAGVNVAVLDAQTPGWGASGRNGGFCCLGGSKLTDDQLDRRFGPDSRREWRQTEIAAVRQVSDFLAESGTDADVHSKGETWLAHRPSRMRGIDEEARRAEENYGVAPVVHSVDDLPARGLNAGFDGGMTLPLGFALNPRKYLAGLLRHCLKLGVSVYSQTPVEGLAQSGTGWHLRTGTGQVAADEVLIATNGYSSEDIPASLAARYMPAQSSVVVTRPLTRGEKAAQGWTSRQMCYDSRNLLHYFRLMPDDRMLFGMRGGLGGSPGSEARAQRRVERDFRKMFPEWRGVELTHYWSGMVCLAPGLLPIVGAAPEGRGIWLAMCYHGNGVAMGSRAGWLAARAILGDDQRPDVLRRPAERFPLSTRRRALMYPAYLGFALQDLMP